MADAVNNIALVTTSARHLTEEQKGKLQKATKEFEAIFVQMMLKSMRGAQGEELNEFGGESYGGGTMKGMFDSELSKHIGGQGKLGIAQSLYRKLTGESLPGTSASSASTEKMSSTVHASKKKNAGAAPVPAAVSADRVIQQLNESADNLSSEEDGDTALLSLSSTMERLQSMSVQAKKAFSDMEMALQESKGVALAEPSPASDSGRVRASAPAPGAPAAVTVSWTTTTIQAQNMALPPSVQTTRPVKAALTASAAITPQPSRPDASQTISTASVPGSTAALDRVKAYDAIIAKAADTVGVNGNLLKAMIVEESGAKAHARSPKNAKGLMQLIDTTAESMGVKNVWDPHQNIEGGARYLKQQLQKFNGNISLALASYNAGPGNVERYNGIPPFRETQNYVKRVMKVFNALQHMESKSDDVIK